MLAPVSASISTPVLLVTVAVQRMTASSPCMSIWTLQFSSPRGWQNGISSCVRLAAITPAMMAVWNTGPFALLKPLPRSASATLAGNNTRASATAVRLVTALSATSTMVGWFCESRWEKEDMEGWSVVSGRWLEEQGGRWSVVDDWLFVTGE